MMTFFRRRIAAVGASALALGCGSSRPGDFEDAGSGSGSEPVADAAAQAQDATVAPPGDGGGLVLIAPADAGHVSSICTAGLYEGQFMTYVGAGGEGGSPGPFAFMWNGGLSIDLKARTVIVSSGGGSGESFATDTSLLEIAEGGALDGGDTMGGTFFANLDGELDCDPDAGPPYKLQATLLNGTYRQVFYSIQMGGTLTAEYQASSPPMLTNGQILVWGFLTDGGAPFASASGTWTATWASP